VHWWKARALLLRESPAGMFVLFICGIRNESMFKLLCWSGNMQNIADWWVEEVLFTLRI
jgi:hypothetical protein